MFEHLPKQCDLAGKEGGVAEHFWQRSARAPTSVFTEGRRLCTAAGSAGTGAWARRGAHSTAHQEQWGPVRGCSSALKQGTDRMREQKLIVVGACPIRLEAGRAGGLVSCGQPVGPAAGWVGAAEGCTGATASPPVTSPSLLFSEGRQGPGR